MPYISHYTGVSSSRGNLQKGAGPTFDLLKSAAYQILHSQSAKKLAKNIGSKLIRKGAAFINKKINKKTAKKKVVGIKKPRKKSAKTGSSLAKSGKQKGQGRGKKRILSCKSNYSTKTKPKKLRDIFT